MHGHEQQVRMAEVVASLSLATDLLMGQPMEHALRTCLMGSALGERAGLSREELSQVYWISLLAWIGCTADPHDLVEHFGDDIEIFRGAYDVDLVGFEMMRFLGTHAGSGQAPLGRAKQLWWFATSGTGWAVESFSGKCEIAEDLSQRLGMEADVRLGLQQVYERWDGKGMPDKILGDQILPAVRVFQLAEISEVHHRLGGLDAALAVVRERAGTQFDPELCDLFERYAADMEACLAEPAAWDAVMAAEPQPATVLRGPELDVALEAVADFVDLKSPFQAGHSRGVASLARAAARRLSLERADVESVYRAGLVHDLGRIGIPESIWEKPGPLSDAEFERVRMHPYFTERILARSSLASVGALASLHHERCDGSGYHRGAPRAALSLPACILAAADAYHATVEHRPHRPARTPDEAARIIRAEVGAGKLDGRAAEAVLECAGHPVAARASWPAGLTDREIDVLRLIAVGLSKREVGRALHISPSTADHHIRHIYQKAGVSSRAGATLFAMKHGLLDVVPGDPATSGRAT